LPPPLESRRCADEKLGPKLMTDKGKSQIIDGFQLRSADLLPGLPFDTAAIVHHFHGRRRTSNSHKMSMSRSQGTGRGRHTRHS
jgi:hypothetical protein